MQSTIAIFNYSNAKNMLIANVQFFAAPDVTNHITQLQYDQSTLLFRMYVNKQSKHVLSQKKTSRLNPTHKRRTQTLLKLMCNYCGMEIV